VKNQNWVRDPIDRFVLARLEAVGLAPAPAAERSVLIRRATFDLTGLPPTPAEIDAFLRDKQPGAFARVVDRLLASPGYGEKWGRHWLDVARYADSNGVDENLVYANAWRYRDYVIRAMNQDKPINRFIREQVAGDLLSAPDNETDSTDRIIATGYLSLGPKMLAEDDPVKQEEDIIDEQVDTLGKTFLGMTIGCARCHDHKFDPLPQTDYYALAGIFKSTRTMKNFQNMAEWQERPLISKEAQDQLVAAEKAIADKKSQRDRERESAVKTLLDAEQPRAAEYIRVARKLASTAAKTAKLKPIISTPDGSAPPSATVVEAEDFVRGNVLKDRNGFGKGIGVLVNAGQYPNRTEYEVDVAKAAPYQIDLRYASGDPRPIRIYLNDKLAAANAAGAVTGGFNPDKQAWFAEGVFQFKAGRNLIRFERESYFPHIDKFLIVSREGEDYPRTREQIAEEAGLRPELLTQAEEQIAKESAKQAAEGGLKFESAPELDSALPAQVQSHLKQMASEIAMLEKSKPNPPRAMAVSDGKPTDLKVHLRGSYLTLGQDCPRRFPVVLAGDVQPRIGAAQSGRLELADWLAAPSNPLTARVFVNRVWRWHFGRGIVPSTDNFGRLGDRPLDPALLDWLATTFVKDGWSLKRLHRRIMLSSAYQMSDRFDPRAARVDPENTRHWRFDRRRLEAEEIRDSILAVSGRLDSTMGGSLLTFKDREYVTSTANADPVNYKSRRRSVYLPVIRSALYDVYTAFDFGDPTVMNGDRPSTTVAPQALFVMNSAIVLEETRSMADIQLARKDVDDDGRIRSLYQTCFGRSPTALEVGRANEFLMRLNESYLSLEPDATNRRLRSWQSFCKALIASNEFCFVE